MKLARSIVLLAALAAVSGCEGIGDGSTVVSIEIRDPGNNPITGTFPLSQCLRDQMVAIATFTDGTLADFSFRVTWTSSDPSVVEVSNGEILQSFVDDGAFTTAAGLTYRPGILVPRGAPGSSATITATFLGMTSSKQVSIGAPSFSIAPLGAASPLQAQPTSFMGPSTFQRLGFHIREPDGHVLLPTSGNLVGALNPVLWKFDDASNVFDPADPAVANDVDVYAVPSAAAPTATIVPGTGLLRAVAAENKEYQVQATTSLCENVPAFTPKLAVRVAPFANLPMTIEHEPDINGAGATPTGDLIAGTGEATIVRAWLDTNNDLATGEERQDLSGLVDMSIQHTLSCDPATDTNCTCDTGGGNCTKRLLGNNGSFLFTLITDDRAEATVQACYTNVDALHSNDCEEDATSATVNLRSGTLDFHVIPVDLSGAGASVQVQPSSAAERAFTYPGQQFDAYGTFTALGGGTPFNGGTSATGTQNITRYVSWRTRKQGSTTEFPPVGFVNTQDDGFSGRVGSFSYLEDVAANTVVDVSVTPAAPFQNVAAPASPVPFTICPSTAGTCSP